MSERDEVLKDAADLGIEASRYWSTQKLLAEIAKVKTDPPLPDPEPKTPDPPDGELQTTEAILDDRMARYRGKNPPCPKCGAHPVIVTMRRTNYSGFRCRSCEHRWDDDKRGN